jgi:hypothetical protein
MLGAARDPRESSKLIASLESARSVHWAALMTLPRSRGRIVFVFAGVVLLATVALSFWLGSSWSRSKAGASPKRQPELSQQEVPAARPIPHWARIARQLQDAANEPVASASAKPASPEPLRQPMGAREERDAQVDALRKSGRANARDFTAIHQAETEWTRAAKDSPVAVEFTPWQCFGAGCYTTATYRDAGGVERFMERLTQTAAFSGWPGAKFQSGAIQRPSGDFELTWIFFTPEAHAAAGDEQQHQQQ